MLISVCVEMTWLYVRQVCTMTIVAVVASYHALLFEQSLVDMDLNCTRIGFEVRPCTASSLDVRKNVSLNNSCNTNFYQYYPQNISNIELFLNYSISEFTLLSSE